MSAAAPLPLAGLTVVDLSRVLAGPYATQLLGDLGADVWKIERPGAGDETRGWGPPFVGGESAYFLAVNRNKRSVTVDFADAVQCARLRRAIARADVVVENFVPGDLARHGLDAATLRRERPELVVCSITGYGQDGPYAALPGYDAVLQGFTGLQSVTGAPDGPATKVGVAVIDVLTGAHAAAAILAALVGRLRHGVGAHLDVALFEVGVASLVNVSQAALATGQPARRHGNAHPQIVPYQTFETADGALVIAVGNDTQWTRLCDALERPEWKGREDWAHNPDRVLHRAEVVTAIAERLAGGTRDAWLARLVAARVPAGAVREVGEVVADPALRARDMVSEAVVGEGARVPVFKLPWKLDGIRPGVRLPPPRLGEHTREFATAFA